MTIARTQKRRAVRRALAVDCQVVRERDFSLVAERAIDVSPDGMLVTTDARVLTGDALILTFREPRSGRWFDATATVARVVHARRGGDRQRCLGLMFDALPADDHAALTAALAGYPPRLPRLRSPAELRAAT